MIKYLFNTYVPIKSTNLWNFLHSNGYPSFFVIVLQMLAFPLQKLILNIHGVMYK